MFSGTGEKRGTYSIGGGRGGWLQTLGTKAKLEGFVWSY